MDSSYINAELDQLKGQVGQLSETVEAVKKEVSDLKEGITTIKRSEVIRMINDSEPVGMECKTIICLDGMVTAESIVKHTTDSIHVTPNGVFTKEENRKKQF